MINTKSIVKKVKKSKSELTGPKDTMNLLMKANIPSFWSLNIFFINVVGCDGGLGNVVEKIV